MSVEGEMLVGLIELEQDIGKYSPKAHQSNTAPLPDEEFRFLQRWLELVTLHINTSNSIDASPASMETNGGNRGPTGYWIYGEHLSQEEFASVVIARAATILRAAYPDELAGKPHDHILFYRVMKDDFSSDAHTRESKDSASGGAQINSINSDQGTQLNTHGIATRLYRCLKTLLSFPRFFVFQPDGIMPPIRVLADA